MKNTENLEFLKTFYENKSNAASNLINETTRDSKRITRYIHNIKYKIYFKFSEFFQSTEKNVKKILQYASHMSFSIFLKLIN